MKALNILYILNIAALISSANFSIKANEENAPNRKKVKLTSKVLKLIDGVHGAMDERKIRDIMYTGREIVKIQYGAPLPNNPQKKMGYFKHNNRLYTLEDVVKLEEKYLHKHPNGNPLSDPSIKLLFGQTTVKFRETVKPYIDDARRFKHITLKLIDEFCTKMRRSNSYLNKWGEGDNEKELFFKYIRSNKDLHIFCSDLTSFMSSMIESCPKGYQKYIAWKEKFKN